MSASAKPRWWSASGRHGEIIDVAETFRVYGIHRVTTDDGRVAPAEDPLEADQEFTFEEIGTNSDMIDPPFISDVRDMVDHIV